MNDSRLQFGQEQAADEVRRLQRCLNDLVSILALPAMWSGRDAAHLGHTLVDVLLGLLQLDLVAVRLTDEDRGTPVEMVRVADPRSLAFRPEEIAALLGGNPGAPPLQWPEMRRFAVEGIELSIAPFPLGLHGEMGRIIVGSRRPDFPDQDERLLLNIAANQAAIGLREARLLRDQKQVASELDQRVARRTAELAAANEELRKEIADRRLAETRLVDEERQLKQSEARKAAILDSALDGIVTFDHAGRITEFNPAAERTFGHRRQAVLGRLLADVIIPPALRAQYRVGLLRDLTAGETVMLGKRVEMTAMRADGSEFAAELAITRIPLEGPPAFTGYLRDITERKRFEEELRRSEAFLAEGQRLTITGSFAWRVATGEITWSDELYRMFEFDRAKPVTLTDIGTRVHPDDLPLLYDMLNRVSAEASGFEYEHRLLMADQSVKHLHLVAHARRTREGALEYIGAVQDVTERRRSEEALGRLQSELAHMARVTSLGALTASIAHEVNQPLSGIVTNASTSLRMLGSTPPNVEGALETARRTIRDAKRASDVITRLRALFNRKAVTAEPVDLNEAAREVVALSAGELQRGRVTIRTEFHEAVPTIFGDRVQLQQVMLNLLRNAVEAMSRVEDRTRLVVIRTGLDLGETVRLSVEDTGTGLDPEASPRLFEAFYSTKATGMGIGLSVSRTIIEGHGGRLWATPNEGPGATFSFTIPIQAARAPSMYRGDGGAMPTVTAKPEQGRPS